MSGKRNRVLAMLAAAVMLPGALAGCGSGGGDLPSSGTEGGPQNVADAGDTGAGSGGSTAKGRYLETEIELPEGADKIYAMGKLADGSVTVAAAAGGTGLIFRSQDMGETWETTGTVQGLADSWIQGGSVAPDGTIALVGYFMDIDDMAEAQLVLIAPDGTKQATPIILPPTESDAFDNNMVEQIGYDADGTLFVLDLNHDILKADLTTGVCAKAYDWTGSQIEYFAIAGQTLLMITEEGLPRFRTTDGSTLSNAAALDDIVKNDYSMVQRAAESTFPMVMTAGVEEGSILYANHNGVFYYKEGGSISEQLVSAELSSLGVTSDYYSILMLDAEHFLIHMVDATGKNVICRYSYDKDVPAVPDRELNIYALEESRALRQAVSIYQKQNQNVYVRLTIGMTGADGISAEDAISTLNTEILAGNVPDVMILDGLPAESYIEKGILGDIGGLIDQIEQSDGLLAGVRDMYRTGEGCYRFPARILLTIASGPEEGVKAAATLEGFADYAEQLRQEYPDQKILNQNPPKELLWNLYQIDSASWFDADGNLKEDALSDFLTLAKRLYDIDSYPDDTPGIHVYGDMPVGSARDDGLATGGIRLACGTVTSMTDFVGHFAIAEQAGTTFDAFGEGAVFVPQLLAGISSTTKVRDEAEAFLRTMIGPESGAIDGYGFPVDQAAWKELRAYAAEQYGPDSMISIGFSSADGQEGGYMMNTMTEENLVIIEEMLQKAGTPADTDAVIRELVIDQGVRYLKGESSKEEALAALKQKISLYLAE